MNTSLPQELTLSKAVTDLPAISEASNSNSTVTLPSAVCGTNSFETVTGFPPAITGEPASLSMRVPVTVYVLPGIRLIYFTSSRIFTFSSAFAAWPPVSLSRAAVPPSGKWIVCASSSISSCANKSTLVPDSGSMYSTVSYRTALLPLSSSELTAKYTSMLPLLSFGVKIFSSSSLPLSSAITASSSRASSSPAGFSITLPRTAYSAPGTRSS